MHKGIWCFAEVRHGKLTPSIYELISAGKQLASQLQENLAVVILGHLVKGYAEELAHCGAELVYALDHPSLENFLDEIYTQALGELIEKEKPSKILFPASTLGRSLAARLAVRLHTGLVSEVTNFTIDSTKKHLVSARPCFGGNLMADVICENHRPEMATIRPMAFPKAQKDEKKGAVREVPLNPASWKTRTKFVQFVPEETKELDLGAAEKICSGGRGLGKPEGFELVRELAKALGAALGASRAVVDSGWIPYRHQVGLTGRTVRPKVYFACGISGQVQHLAGMSSSDVIVAINNDPNAPLMKLATFALEGNLYEIIPAIIREVKKLKGEPVDETRLKQLAAIGGVDLH